MVTLGAVRVTAGVICVAGIAGMIVTSILNHNGAAVTFGLITAVAIVCSMVAKAVATSTERQVLARTGAAAATPQEAHAGASPHSAAEDLGMRLESQAQTLIDAGADQDQLRRLIGDAVALGRALAGRSQDKRAGR